MNSISGIVMDVYDHGLKIGVDFRPDDGTSRCLVVNKQNTLIVASINGALAHGDRIEIGFTPIPPRLGSPMGEIVSLSVLDHQLEIGHAA